MRHCEDDLDKVREDVLREIASIGSGHAATALASILGRPIERTAPSVMLVCLSGISDILGGADKVVVAGLLELKGDISGYLLMLLDFEQAEKVTAMMCGTSVGRGEEVPFYQLSELDQSALSEMVNILGGCYLTAIGEMTGLVAGISVPYLCVDMVGAVISVAVTEIGKTGDLAMLFQSELYNDTDRIVGNLLLIPNKDSCDKILESLGYP